MDKHAKEGAAAPVSVVSSPRPFFPPPSSLSNASLTLPMPWPMVGCTTPTRTTTFFPAHQQYHHNAQEEMLTELKALDAASPYDSPPAAATTPRKNKFF